LIQQKVKSLTIPAQASDYEVDYCGFRGTIPKGEYGARTVIIWDRGTWSPIGDARQAYATGNLDFELNGEKLRGHWNLVRMREKPGAKRENWLLIKDKDAFAQTCEDTDILEERPESVRTGQMMPVGAKKQPPASKAVKTAKTGNRRFVEPTPIALAPDPDGLTGAGTAGADRRLYRVVCLIWRAVI
jgi:bifunctional non-homologous end joining protein LigD